MTGGLRFQAVSKRFPGVVALDGVSFDVAGGSVHALCGENGAGKSTLLKVLSGVYSPDSGGLELDGKAHSFASAHAALAAGVAVIYQELNVVRDVSIAENIWLGHLPRRGPLVDWRALREKTSASLAAVGLDLDPMTPLSRLSLAQRQMVEIAKALSRNAQVIAFDEPTSSLSRREVDRLFEIINALRDQGRVILYVTHRMDEVQAICQSGTVLRDGRHIVTWPSLEGITPEEIVRQMVGREIADVYGEASPVQGETAFAFRDVTGPGIAERVSLEVKSGEIVGFFGLIGAGRTELLRAVFTGSEGIVEVKGQSVPRKGPLASLRNGVILLPEDRKHEGIIPALSVGENICLSRRQTARQPVLRTRDEKAVASEQVQRLAVKTASLETPIWSLSGGNQQKVIFARGLLNDCRVLLLDEPTRGVDVGAKAEIYGIIRDLARQGVAVIFVSSDLPEVLGLADRICVMAEGRLVATLPKSEASEERLLSLALPQSRGVA